MHASPQKPRTTTSPVLLSGIVPHEYVVNVLGHRDINTTLLYTQLVSFESDDYHSATAKTTEKAEQLVEAGFEYVCTTPQDVMLFRKRK